jgi:hypothetical protein
VGASLSVEEEAALVGRIVGPEAQPTATLRAEEEQ